MSFQPPRRAAARKKAAPGSPSVGTSLQAPPPKLNQVLAAALLGPSKYIFPRFGLNLTIAWEQIFGLGRPAGQRAAAAGAFKKAHPLGPKRLGSRESIHAGQSVPAPHLVPSRSLDQRLVCPGPRSGCPQRVRVRPGLMSRPFTVRCTGEGGICSKIEGQPFYIKKNEAVL